MQATLIDGPVGKQLRELTLPMVWAILAMMSYNVVDTFFVAQLGDAPLAAMSFTFPVIMVLTSVAIGAGAGLTSCLSRAIGARDKALAQRLTTDGISLLAVVSIVIAVIGWLTIEPVFHLLGAEDELMPYIRDYMVISYLGVPTMILGHVGMSALRAQGLSKIQGVIMTAGALLNIALDPLLIFGLWGFPRLELAGAAWATVIIRAGVFVIAMYYVAVKMQMFTSPVAPLKTLMSSWRTIFHVGLPAIATNMIIPMSSGVVVALVAQHGTEAVAGLGVAVRVEPIALIVFYALSAIMGAFFGQNLGAGRFERLDEALRILTAFCFGWGILMALLLYFFADSICGWFSDSPDVAAICVAYLSIVPISYGAYGLVMSVNAAFNGLAKPMPGLVISSARVLVLYLPMAMIGNSVWGVHGLFAASAVCNLVTGLIGWWWLKRTIRQLESEAEPRLAPQQA